MNEIRFEKTARRKWAEAILIFWGFVGMISCFWLFQQVYRFEMAAVSTDPQFNSAIPVLHTLIWIGGVVFLGFFALLAPVKMTIVPADKSSFG